LTTETQSLVLEIINRSLYNLSKIENLEQCNISSMQFYKSQRKTT